MKKRQRGRALRVEPLEKKLMLDAGSLVITEFMAKNESTLLDSDGEYCDWIEIHNPTDSPINLQGWHLTDDATELDKWTFPDVTIEADAYMIVFASDKDRTDPTAELHTNFKLTTAGEYLGLIQPDETVAFDYSPSFPEQYEDISYGGDPGEYFLTPTPGAENASGSLSDSGIEFSRSEGVFFESFFLEMITDIPDAVIRFTINGDEPTSTSTQYNSPLYIYTSTTIRAKIFSPLLPKGGILDYKSYVAMDSSLNDWESNLPVIILDAPNSVPNETSYVETSAVFFEPGQDGVTDLNDLPVLDTLSGIKIRGSSSTTFPKKQYSFETWNGTGEDLDVSLFGLPEGSDWVLYAPYSDKSLMRNYLAYTWSDAMGEYAPRVVFCEVFLNTDDRVVKESDYVGVYLLVEKIRIDEDRIDIEEISGGTAENPEVTGGVILKVDRSESDEYVFTSSYGQEMVVHKPNLDELNSAEKAYIVDTINNFETALYGPDFADPEIGYAAYIDVESFIDEHIMVELMKNIDGYRLSNYFYFDDETKLTSGPIWDYNLSLGNANYLGGDDPTGWFYTQVVPTLNFPDYPFYDRLFEDPNFVQQYIDRWAELRSTIFATDVLLSQIDTMADYLSAAEARDQAVWNTLGTYVWPNAYIGNTYEDEITYLRDFLTQRLAWIDSQFLNAPVYSEESEQVEPGTELEITVPNATGATIYYTTDGTDPRLSGGDISPTAQAVSGTIETPIFEMGSEWYYNDTGTDLGTAWRESGYDYSSWTLGQGQFGYGEGDETTVVDYGDNASAKYTTTYFLKSFEVTDPTAIEFLTLDLLRDDGAVIYLNGQEVVRSNIASGTVTYDTFAELATGDGQAVCNYTIDSGFLVEGTNYIAVEVHQANLTSSDLSFDLALSISTTISNLITIDETVQIIARTYSDGLWSAPTERLFVTNPELTPIVSEIMYHPSDPTSEEETAGFVDSENFEFIEIYNPHEVAISLNGLVFTDGIEFDFATDSNVLVLQPDQRIVLVNNKAAIFFRYGSTVPIAGEYEGKLANSGEQLLLTDSQGNVIQNIPYSDASPWATEADGGGSSLVAIAGGGNESDPSYWFASEEVDGTPGWAGVIPTRMPGDANLDDRVDGSDVTILAGNWQVGVNDGQTATWSMGDFNGDGKVDGSDVTILAGNWQAGVTSTVVTVSDPKEEEESESIEGATSTDHFIPPTNASLGIATVPRRESLPTRRLATPISQATDFVLAASNWNESNYAAVAKDLIAISTKKSTSAKESLFALEIDPHADME